MADRTTDEGNSLAIALLVRAGCMMEDDSPALLLGVGPADTGDSLNQRIACLARVASSFAAAASAALRTESD